MLFPPLTAVAGLDRRSGPPARLRGRRTLQRHWRPPTVCTPLVVTGRQPDLGVRRSPPRGWLSNTGTLRSRMVPVLVSEDQRRASLRLAHFCGSRCCLACALPVAQADGGLARPLEACLSRTSLGQVRPVGTVRLLAPLRWSWSPHRATCEKRVRTTLRRRLMRVLLLVRRDASWIRFSPLWTTPCLREGSVAHQTPMQVPFPAPTAWRAAAAAGNNHQSRLWRGS
jgi:hypothetical protein